MAYVRKWEEDPLSASFSKQERDLPLLPTILAGVLTGVAGACLAFSAGYGIIAAMVCYVIGGAVVSLLLPLAFHKLITLRADSDRKETPEFLSEGGVSGELDELDQHFLGELEWLVHRGQGNTTLGLYQGSQVMFVAGGTKEACDIRNSFTEAGFKISDSQSLKDAMLIILDAPERWGLLCIDFDAFGGVTGFDTVVEQLVSFRNAASSVPVMLISRSFSIDNFYLVHRPSIADGCLRVPAADSSVVRALKDVCVNNLIWQYCRDRA
ncbi:hypothetical protein [uncultured Ruegeria sp.]|uniref:hypothetical protein n=1 Tax=uncultured Ruegeria sp. TaxID=259304 RepID=UPI0026122FE1|nr:hypothetical protein [uncultured Ruegeria sp.]